MATAAAANESRGELLSWLANLLQMPVPRIESVGTGAALCQIADSIFGDVPLHKVKFNAQHEYEYVQNFKVFQAALSAHHIDKAVPVERLVKMRFQDNLEFLQWMKKFWDEHYGGGPYDAAARRRGAPGASGPAKHEAVRQAPLAGAAARSSAAQASMSRAASGTRPAPVVSNPASSAIPSSPHAGSSAVAQLQAQIATLQEAVAAERVQSTDMAKERDFYFQKLREIEHVMQQVKEPVLLESSLFREITTIMYKTDDGYETPATALAPQ